MNNLIDFIKFPKIPRLTREVIVSEKIDGTNGCIYIGQDGSFLVGSRSRWITPSDDNHGFAAWAMANKEALLKLGVGLHHGEWWGCGIQRGYGLKEKRFSLFNTSRWAAHGVTLQNIPNADPRIVQIQQYPPSCCHVVPVICSGLFDTSIIDRVLLQMQEKGSLAAPGFMNPEGVIIYHTAGNLFFKKTIEKDTVWKGRG